MPLSKNLFRLESSIITQAKQAINQNNEAGNSLNAVEHEPVPTRVLNPNASEASYKPKQRSYRRTKLNLFFIFFPNIFQKNSKFQFFFYIFQIYMKNRQSAD